jgi:hypothetical protein
VYVFLRNFVHARKFQRVHGEEICYRVPGNVLLQLNAICSQRRSVLGCAIALVPNTRGCGVAVPTRRL